MPHRESLARLDAEELDLWKALIRVSQLLPTTLDQALREQGESLPRYEILAVLSAHPTGLRMSELGRLALVSKPRLTVHVAELEDDGFVVREPDPSDGRASITLLTREGRSHLLRLAPDHVELARRLVLDRIDPGHRDVLVAALAEILAGLGDQWRPGS